MSNSNVLYVEPNYVSSKINNILTFDNLANSYVDTNQVSITELSPDLSDFSIAVDLEVEVHDRISNATSNQGNKVIIVKFNSGNDKDNYKISFLQGTKCKYGDKEMNYLTTAPYECNTLEDIINNGSNNEMFGINSIDIEYNNYMVPVVTIKFTDIRGVSLFAPEELRHDKVYNGIRGYSSSDIAGSFFKCFFTFPYPKFSLMVKGFYGYPVTYELTCSDFKASFESSTGNFNATATFIGYSFALINDVTVNALVAAPLSEYNGAEYWKNRKFKFENSETLMPTINELLLKYKQLQSSFVQINKDDSIYHKQVSLENELSGLKKLSTLFSTYFDTIDLELNRGSVGYKSFVDNNNKIIVCYLLNDKFNRDVFDNSISASKLNFVSHWETQFGSDYAHLKNISLSLYDENNDFYNEYIKKYYSELKNECSDTSKVSFYVFDGYATNDFLKEIDNVKTNEKTEIDKKVSQKTDANIERVLGFKPTVKNMTHIMLAHLETLLNCIYKASEEVKNRTLSDLSLEYTDINKNKTKNVCLFPQVNSIVNDNIEDTWIGDIDGGEDSPEAKLIHGLLNGIDEFQKTTDEVIGSLNSSYNNGLCVNIPTAISDVISKENPFNSIINYSDLSDFVGRLFLRMANSIGSNLYNDTTQSTNLFKQMGKADAHNFYEHNKAPSTNFLNIINTGLLNTPSSIINFALSKGEEGKPNAWDGNSCDESPLLINNGSHYCIYFLNKGSYRALPICGGDWSRILSLSKDNDFGSVLIDNSSYSNGEDISYSEFHIDLNVDKYKKLEDNFNSEEYSELKKYFSVSYDAEKMAKCYGKTRWYELESATVIQEIFRSKYSNIPSGAKFINSLDDKNLYKEKADHSGDLIVNTGARARQTDFTNRLYYYESDKITYGSEKYDKRKEDVAFYNRIEKCFEDLGNSKNYTLTQFPGYYKGEVTLNKCLFAQKEYYELKNIYEKAYVFLNLFEIDGDIVDFIENKDKHFEILPYLLILKYGAYYWRKENYFELHGDLYGETRTTQFLWFKKTKISYLDNPMNDIKSNKEGELSSETSDIRKDVKNRLINEFKNWVDNYYISKIHSQFAITNNDYSKLEKIEKEVRENHKTNLAVEYNFYVDCVNKDNYIAAYSLKGGSTIFINRDNSPSIDYLVNLIIKPCVIVKTIANLKENNIDSNSTNSNIFNIKHDHAVSYINGFLETLNSLYSNLRQINTIKKENTTTCTIDKNIKIALYKYLKILWDRWLVGTENWQNIWAYKSFKKNWHFIDSFFNEIGNDASLNIKEFIDVLTHSQQQESYSLLTFLSGVYSKNRFNLYNVQNFLSMSDKEKMDEMFKPLPYNRITNDMLKRTSDFVVVYTYEYSSKLDLPESSYTSDSFNIGDSEEKNLPIPILNKRECDYKVPCFGVTYGKQYQSYFKDVSVSMDSPMATEQALRAKFQIAGMHSSESGENGKTIVPIGPDLYTIYANNSYTCNVKMMGCAWIQPLMIFQLNNIPMFRGSYLIQKVTHHIEPGNMETTIVGTRMSKYSNRKFEEPWLVKDNIENGGKNYNEDYQNKNASIYNDCEYKFFNPISSNANPGLTEEDLNLTVREYGNKYGGWKFTLSDSNLEKTMSKFLGDIAYGEAGNQDDLGIKLVLTVIYNRCMHCGDFTKVLFNQYQHEIGKTTTNAKFENFAKEIFTQTPIVLSGITTTVARKVPIWNNGVMSNLLSESKAITLDDLQTIDGYCTTLGYDSNYTPDSRTGLEPTPPTWWHGKGAKGGTTNVIYSLQHDTSDRVFGHVFVSGAYGKVIKHWDVLVDSEETLTNDDLINSLFESIKKTINYSNNIKIDEIKKEIIDNSQGIFDITTNSQSGTATVFDVVLNTYSKYVQDLIWVVDKSTTELPTKIRIKVNLSNLDKRRVFISTQNDINTPCNLIFDDNGAFLEGCNELFYVSIKKRYGSNLNKNNFKGECFNFNQVMLTSGWENKIINIMNKINVDNCKMGYDGGFDTSGKINSKYSWDSFTNDLANKLDPVSPKISPNGFSVSDMVSYVVSHIKSNGEDGGQCAKYVRIAMEHGGMTADTTPNSACVYKKHLPVWGFTKVAEGNNHDGSTFALESGDISVAASSKDHVHGHIQIYNANTKMWYSDKAFKSICGYKSAGIPYEIYRYIPNNNNA